MDIILNPTVQSVEVNTPETTSTVVVREDDTSLEIIGQGTTSVVAETNPEATVIIVQEEVGSVNVKTVEDHTHPISEITALQAALDGKANTSHSHDASHIVSGTLANARVSQGSVTQHQAALSVTKSQVSDFAHTHTEAEIVDLGNYADEVHTHLTGQIVDWPAEFPPSAHTHTEAEITDLGNYSEVGHTHTLANITDSGTSAALNVAAVGDAAIGEVVKGDDTRLSDARTPTAHTHDDRYYTEGETDTLLSGKSDTSHLHDDRYYTETETNNLLDGKAELVHTHTKSQITDFEHEHPAEQVQMNTDFDLRDWYDSIQSAGRLSGGKITDNGDGTVAIAFGRGLIKAVSSTASDGEECELGDCGQISETQYVTFDSVASLALTDNAYNYIYYEGATGTIKATTDFYSVDFTRDFTVGRAYRSGTNVVARLCGTNLWNFNRRVQLFGEEYLGVVRARGLNVGTTGTRNLTVSEGILWAEGINRFLVSAFDSSGLDRFTYWYRNGSGGWTQQINQSQINNTQYDNGSGTLQTLTNNRFGVHWVYVVHDSSVHVVFGQDNYQASAAEAATPPTSIPGLLEAYATLAARIRVEKSSDTLNIDSAFTQVFQTSGITSHDDLSNIGVYTHPQIDTHIDDDTLHRVINDSGTTTTNLWSGSKINSELGTKANSIHTHTKSQITDFAHTHPASEVTGLEEIATSGSYTDLSDVPLTFAPSAHSHPISDVTNLQSSLDGKAAVSHNHTLANITDSGTAAALDVAAVGDAAVDEVVKGNDTRLSDARTPTAHTHDDRYYTESETDTLLSGKSDTGHLHDDRYYTETETNSLLSGKANTSHTHSISEVTSLQSALDGKAAVSHNHTLANITDSGTAASLDVAAVGDAAVGEVVKGNDTRLTNARTPTAHTHTEADITDLGNYSVVGHTHTKANITDFAHTHPISEVTNLQSTLDGKAATSHTHTLANITDSGTAAALDVPSSGDAAVGEVVKGNDTRLTNARTPTAHTHDDRYYTESETDTLLSGKAPTSHTHSTTDITNLSSYTGLDARYYTETETNSLLSGKSDTSHNHTLDGLSNTTITSNSNGEILRWNGSAWVNNTLAEAGIAPTSHTHTKSQITDFAHTHPAGEVTGLATVATTGAYSDLTGIPSTFTPASHTHGNITNAGAIGTTTNLVVTTTTGGVLTTSSRSGIDSRSTFPPSSHTHDDRYYTETETNSLLSGKSDTTHNHTLDGLSNTTITSNSNGEILKWNGSAWVNNTLAEAGIAPTSHTHTKSQITDFAHTHPAGEVTGLATVATTGAYSDLSGVPSTFTPSSHTHPISEVTNLQTSLDDKADLSRNFKYSSYTLTDGNGWYRVASGSGGGDSALVRIWGLAGSNRQTNMLVAISGMGYGQLPTVNVLNSLRYNNNHILNFRVGSETTGVNWALDLELDGIDNPTTLHISILSNNFSAITPVFNPEAMEGSIVTESGRRLGGQASWDWKINSLIAKASGGADLTGALSTTGTATIGTVDNGTGDFVTATSGGLLGRRTAAQTLSDIGAAASSHTHSTTDITNLSSYTGLDSRYYTETEVNSLLSGKSDTGHNHTLDSLSNTTITSNSAGEILKWSGSAWINNTLAEAGIAAASHTHTKSQITDFAHTHTTTDITNLSSYTGFDSRYYTETEVNSLLNAKVTGNTAITAATKTKITYDTKGLVTAGADLAATDIPNLDTAKITTGTFADARISQSSVTQHQGALSITESQISDLGTYALDNAVVKLTGDQTIAGEKTFTNPTTKFGSTTDGTYLPSLNLRGLDYWGFGGEYESYVALNNAYYETGLGFRSGLSDWNNYAELLVSIDGSARIEGADTGVAFSKYLAFDEDVVKLTGNQTVAGTKTFSSTIWADDSVRFPDGKGFYTTAGEVLLRKESTSGNISIGTTSQDATIWSQDLTLYFAGNYNAYFTDYGDATGRVGLFTNSPSAKFDVNGDARIRTLSNATGDFVTSSATGVLQKRTAAETLSDIGAWHNGNLPIWNSSATFTAFTYDVAYSFSVGSMYLLTVRIITSGASRSATYVITIGGAASSQQVFTSMGEQGYGSDYLSSVTPTGSGWRFTMNNSVLQHTASWGIMRLGYNLI